MLYNNNYIDNIISRTERNNTLNTLEQKLQRLLYEGMSQDQETKALLSKLPHGIRNEVKDTINICSKALERRFAVLRSEDNTASLSLLGNLKNFVSNASRRLIDFWVAHKI